MTLTLQDCADVVSQRGSPIATDEKLTDGRGTLLAHGLTTRRLVE